MFTKTLNLGSCEYDMIRRMSSWALGGFGDTERKLAPAQQQDKEMYRNENGSAPAADVPSVVGHERSVKEKLLIGLKCKRLLNQGRLLFLAKHGYEAELVTFCDRSITPENTLLVAGPCQTFKT